MAVPVRRPRPAVAGSQAIGQNTPSGPRQNLLGRGARWNDVGLDTTLSESVQGHRLDPEVDRYHREETFTRSPGRHTRQRWRPRRSDLPRNIDVARGPLPACRPGCEASLPGEYPGCHGAGRPQVAGPSARCRHRTGRRPRPPTARLPVCRLNAPVGGEHRTVTDHVAGDQICADSGSSEFIPVFPMCGAVCTTICRRYGVREGSPDTPSSRW